MGNIDNIKMEDRNYDSNNDKPTKAKRGRRLSCGLLIVLLGVALISGAVGGVGSVIFLSGQDGLLSSLGIDKKVSIPTTETKKIVVEESSAVIDAVDKVKPSVVSVVAKETVMDLFGNTSTQTSGGSGFIITSDGLIVTNKHVVGNKKLNYEVYLNDGSKYSAKIVSKDPFNDLAVLRIKADDLPVVEIGSSSELQVGQHIIAIGNALGEFQNTVTLGVVSAKNRDLGTQKAGGQVTNFEGLVQVDAAVNRGNSGGPLINLEGQVVGVNVAKAEQADNIGFAIPSTVVRTAIESLQKYDKIVRPYLGVRYTMVTPELAEKNDLAVSEGAIIYSGSLNQPAVVKNSPADKAGLKERDIITKVNGKKVSSSQSLSRLLQQYMPGDKVKITFNRDDKSKQTEVELDRHDNFE